MSKTTALLSLVALVSALGCSRKDTPATGNTTTTTNELSPNNQPGQQGQTGQNSLNNPNNPGSMGQNPTGASNSAADNTGINERDRGETKTSGDQKENATDLKLTQDVRQALVADKSLSTNAHNVKIITADGVVTLRGPVKSAQERDKVAAKAQAVAGVKRVDNQLEVAY